MRIYEPSDTTMEESSRDRDFTQKTHEHATPGRHSAQGCLRNAMARVCVYYKSSVEGSNLARTPS